LGISGSGEDTALTQWLAQVSAAIRDDVHQYIVGVISVNTLANPTVVTCYGHGLLTGDVITIVDSNCTPTIDGLRTVTRLSANTFSVPVNVTVAGTSGSFSRRYTDYLGGSGQRELILRRRPVQSIVSVYEDPGAYYGEASGPFASTTLLTAGTDYCLQRDTPAGSSTISKSGILLRIGTVWPCIQEGGAGLLGRSSAPGVGNIKVTMDADWPYVPDGIAGAVCQAVAEIRRGASSGGLLGSEQVEDYGYALASPEAMRNALMSARKLLGAFKEPVW